MLRRLTLPRVLAWTLAGTSLLACLDELDEAVDPTTCLSGRRWIGGDRGSPNMYPGRDCVGCHKDNDAPELVIGGTYYPAIARTGDGPQGKDCFGLEGVRVTVTGGDGQVYETTTNEAGNFWFAARDTDIVMPYSVTSALINPVTGLPDRPPMSTSPVYGGCARCHGDGIPSNPDFNVQPDDPEYVNGQAPIGAPGSGGINGYLQFLAEGGVPTSAYLPDDFDE